MSSTTSSLPPWISGVLSVDPFEQYRIIADWFEENGEPTIAVGFRFIAAHKITVRRAGHYQHDPSKPKSWMFSPRDYEREIRKHIPRERQSKEWYLWYTYDTYQEFILALAEAAGKFVLSRPENRQPFLIS